MPPSVIMYIASPSARHGESVILPTRLSPLPLRSEMRVSERRVCRVLGQHRSTQRRLPVGRADEDRNIAKTKFGDVPISATRLPDVHLLLSNEAA